MPPWVKESWNGGDEPHRETGYREMVYAPETFGRGVANEHTRHHVQLEGQHQLGGPWKPWKAEYFYNLTIGRNAPQAPTGGPPPQWAERKRREEQREEQARLEKVKLRRRTEAALKDCCTQCEQDAKCAHSPSPVPNTARSRPDVRLDRYGQRHGVGCKCGPCAEAPQVMRPRSRALPPTMP